MVMSGSGSNNEILCIGELNVDLIANGLLSEPSPGYEILAKDFEITLGSASAIFASGTARLGRGVTFLSRVGEDDFGRFCIKKLSENGVSTEFVKIDETSKTGVTIVLSTPQDRAMVTFLGAIAELSLMDIPLDILDNHRHLHLTSYFLQTNLQPDFSNLMVEAKRRGLTISFDPNSDPTQSWEKGIFKVIENADVLFLNELEAKQLTGKKEIGAAVRHLGNYCPTAVVKLGKSGAIGINNGEIVEIKGFSVEAVDTTGAGDSFAAGFIHAFLDKKDLRECLKTGNACGALSTRQAGGTNAQPNIEELKNFLTKTGVAFTAV